MEQAGCLSVFLFLKTDIIHLSKAIKNAQTMKNKPVLKTHADITELNMETVEKSNG